MASCVRNIPAKNYQNIIIGFQVKVDNVGDVFGTQCINIQKHQYLQMDRRPSGKILKYLT